MTTIPEAFAVDDATPTLRVRARWIVAFSLAAIGVAAGWFGPIQILLPAQASRLQDLGLGDKEALLAIATVSGAVASMIANPLWGGISDRTRSRWGRRRPTIVVGTGIGVVGLVILGSGDSLPIMIAGWIVVQIGLNGPFAALAATIADRVPPDQRGLVGAVFGIAQTVGVVLGTAIAVVAGEARLGYLAIAVAVPALVVAFLLVHHEPSTRTRDVPSGQPAHVRQAFWRGLRPTRLFTWAWTIRFLLNFANALVLLYVYYYLEDDVGQSDPGSWVLVVTLVVVLLAAVTAGVGGTLSDRWGRRVPFIIGGSIVLAAGAVLMAFVPTLPVVIAAAGLVGIGWGLYISVDLAVLTAGMPSEETHGAMLGIGNIASALPQAIAPAVAAPIVLHLGYTSLYVVAAVVCVAALLCVPGLRGLR